jgi:hypothetical protein
MVKAELGDTLSRALGSRAELRNVEIHDLVGHVLDGEARRDMSLQLDGAL